MTARPTGFRRPLPLLGLILLALGLIALLAQVHPFVTGLADRIAANAEELGGFVPAAALTANHAAQAWAFDRANVLSALRDMLVSCWPVIFVLMGAVLLRNAFNGVTAAHQTAISSSTEGEN
jgi:branched-subunit amino acid transport protein